MWTDALERQKLVEIAYQRGQELQLSNEHYLKWITTFFSKEYIDDVGAGDITSKIVLTKNEHKTAFVSTKMSGIIGGIEEVSWFLRKHNLNVKAYFKDGEEISSGETIMKIQGGQKDVLATERIALNVLQRISGIATETKRLANLLKDYETKIAATRKTLLRYLDKKAVFLGGGLTHRFGLWDSILIKDNHLEDIKSEGIEDYVKTALARALAFTEDVYFIEIEVTSVEEALKAARTFKTFSHRTPYIVMLDNMTPATIEEILETLRENGLYDSVLLEASGEITSKNIREYAKTGIDVVSLGYLTHSAQALDMSLEMKS